MRKVRKMTVEGKPLSNPQEDIVQIQAMFISREVLFSNRSCRQPFSKGRKEWG